MSYASDAASNDGLCLAERTQQWNGAGSHQVEVSANHEELEALFLEPFDFCGGSRRPPEKFSMFLCGGRDGTDGGFEARMILAPAQAERE